MKTIIKWFLLLNKRLYKKLTFVIIMALIPLVVLGLNIIAKQESGFITVALAQTDSNDPISNAVIKDLTSGSGLMNFKLYDTPQQAIESVKFGECDSAWVLLDNLSERVQTFLEEPDASNAMVNVFEREQSVLLRLSHEKLSSALYKHMAEDKYISYIRTNLSQLEKFSDSQLMEYYDSYFVDAEIFEFANGAEVQEVGYLEAPVRGLLSILVVLCVMASAMFFVQDEKKGTFAWASEAKRIGIEFLCQLIAALNISAAMVIALVVSGLTVSIGRELLVAFLFVIACALFGMLVRNIFNSNKILAAITPLAMVVMIAVCPVFFGFNNYRVIQMLFPPTYYINAVTNNKFIIYTLIYIVACAALIFICIMIKHAKAKIAFARRKQ